MRKPQGAVAVAGMHRATAATPELIGPTDPRARQRQRSKRNREMRIAAGFLSINVAGFILFTIVPVGFSLYMAFFHWSLDSGQGSFAGIRNFVNALHSFGFWRVVVNVLYFVGAYVPLNLLVSLLLATLLSPRSTIIKGKALLRVL